jgi:hypothetical protein
MTNNLIALQICAYHNYRSCDLAIGTVIMSVYAFLNVNQTY